MLVEKVKKMQGSEEEEFTTFEDIFALALANTEHHRFTADSDKWHKVLYEVCKKYLPVIYIHLIFNPCGHSFFEHGKS